MNMHSHYTLQIIQYAAIIIILNVRISRFLQNLHLVKIQLSQHHALSIRNWPSYQVQLLAYLETFFLFQDSTMLLLYQNQVLIRIFSASNLTAPVFNVINMQNGNKKLAFLISYTEYQIISLLEYYLIIIAGESNLIPII